ncbi:MAG: hypothetical protein D6790_20500, partial [Caldilineae bacterium]
QALATLGAGAKTAAGYGVFGKKDEGKRNSKDLQKNQKTERTGEEPRPAAPEDWIGRRVYARTMPAVVVGRRGNNLLVRYDEDGEDDEPDEVPIGEAKPI